MASTARRAARHSATAAKRFTSDLVFGKTVTVQPTDTDRYGRTVADVTVGGRDVGLALVEAGLAWHFLRYSSDPKLAAAERVARAARRGLWARTEPGRAVGLPAPSGRECTRRGPSCSTATRRATWYHGPRCQYDSCKNCTIEFPASWWPRLLRATVRTPSATEVRIGHAR